MKEDKQTDDEGILPRGFEVLIGSLLLIISIGFMSLWGLFS